MSLIGPFLIGSRRGGHLVRMKVHAFGVRCLEAVLGPPLQLTPQLRARAKTYWDEITFK